MPENITKVQRWLDLIAYLVGRHFPVPVEELMERLPAYARDWRGGDEKARASVRRKFERDKDELRDLGIPLETVTYTINYGLEEAQGYRISKKDLYLPYLKLLKEKKPAAPPQPEPGSRRYPGPLQRHPRRLHRDPQGRGRRRRLGSQGSWRIFRGSPWLPRPGAPTGSSPSTWIHRLLRRRTSSSPSPRRRPGPRSTWTPSPTPCSGGRRSPSPITASSETR